MTTKPAPETNEPGAAKPIRILIVDDHPLVRFGLGKLIADEPDMEISGEAETVEEALEQIAQAPPDVAIVDLALEKGSGMEVLRRIRTDRLPVKAIVLSMYHESLYAERALRAGAVGYVNKKTANREIIGAIRRVHEGKKYLSPQMLEQVQERFGVKQLDAEAPSVNVLSDRELEVFEGIAEGLETRQIAERLSVSTRTIETHKERIKDKLDLESASSLARRAIHWMLEGYTD